MIAMVAVLLTMWFGRTAGHLLCRKILYPMNAAISALACIAWATALAVLLLLLLTQANLKPFAAFVMFGGLYYLSIPNFGLFDESTVPDEVLLRHVLIKTVTPFVYVAATVLCDILSPADVFPNPAVLVIVLAFTAYPAIKALAAAMDQRKQRKRLEDTLRVLAEATGGIDSPFLRWPGHEAEDETPVTQKVTK